MYLILKKIHLVHLKTIIFIALYIFITIYGRYPLSVCREELRKTTTREIKKLTV